MQVCTSLQTDNHASTPPLTFLEAGWPSCHRTNSVKALKGGISVVDDNWTVCVYVFVCVLKGSLVADCSGKTTEVQISPSW